MRCRRSLMIPIAAVLAVVLPAIAAEPERVVWRGSYTAPYHIAGDCLAKQMSSAFDGAALTAESPDRLHVGLWQGAASSGQPDAAFVIQPAGDGRVEIGWRRASDLPDATRLDEQARSAAIECGGSSA